MTNCDFLIVGGGIVGLATATTLLKERPDAKIVLIEKEVEPGKHQTGRNSGVIHAGVYYAPGSLKANFCRKGVVKTIDFCTREQIPFEQCGKLIVATDALEEERLGGLETRARKNGLDIRRVNGDELTEIEPNISGVAGILVNDTGIVDYGAICRRLADRLNEAGADIRFGVQLVGLKESRHLVFAETTGGDITAKTVIACAGLQADLVAGMMGLADDFRIVPFRGEYYRLPKEKNDIVKHLIYPVPDPAYPFLGIHITRMIDGSVTVGPNAVLSLGRENYERNLPNVGDLFRFTGFSGFWKLMTQKENMMAGFHEAKGSLSKNIYLERCRKYCPDLKVSDLLPYPTGIRAQAVDRNGNMVDDFLIKETQRTVHVCNAPSPAATSAFPIAEEIAKRALERST